MPVSANIDNNSTNTTTNINNFESLVLRLDKEAKEAYNESMKNNEISKQNYQYSADNVFVEIYTKKIIEKSLTGFDSYVWDRDSYAPAVRESFETAKQSYIASDNVSFVILDISSKISKLDPNSENFEVSIQAIEKELKIAKKLAVDNVKIAEKSFNAANNLLDTTFFGSINIANDVEQEFVDRTKNNLDSAVILLKKEIVEVEIALKKIKDNY